MGASYSTGGTGRNVRISDWSSSKCSKIPAYADRRVWTLKNLYKIKDINEFPPQVYSAQDAEADISDCIAGVRLRYSYKVVSTKRLEAIRGKDLRRYALQKFHGYPDMIDQRAISILPYTKENAAIDVRYYKRYRQPYFIVDRITSTVRSRDGKISRQPGQKGTEMKYSYDRADMAKKGKFEAGKKKYDVRKFPLQSMKDGSVGRVIPCSVDPAMCTPGQQTFVSRDVGNALKRAAMVNSKQRKQTTRFLQTSHAKKIQALNKKIASAPPEVKARLQKQRQNMQVKFRLNTAKAEQTNRIQIQSGKSKNWQQKRAALGKQKQAQMQMEKAKKKQEEMLRRQRAEQKAREDAALRQQRAQRRQNPPPAMGRSPPGMKKTGFSPSGRQRTGFTPSAPPMPQKGFSPSGRQRTGATPRSKARSSR
jgi:hypothetical protein